MKTLNPNFGWLVIVLAAFLMLGAGGCGNSQSPTSTQPVIDVQKAAQDARDALARAQTVVDQFQASSDKLHAALAKLPADSPERKAIEQSLASVDPALVHAQLYLTLARIVADAFTPPVPTTQPAK